MTSNDNTAAQLVLFPIQEKRVDECKTDSEMIMQCKLTWSNTLNRIALGELVLSDFDKERCKKALNRMNEICLEHGYTPLYFDF